MRKLVLILISICLLACGHKNKSNFTYTATFVGNAAFYEGLRSTGQYMVTDPSFGGGAKCDGSTDDSTIIQNVDTLATNNNAAVIFPAGTCIVNSTITAGANAVWRGIPGKSIIKTNASINAVAIFTGQSFISGITFDANRLALYTVPRLNDSKSVYYLCQFNNGIVDGLREAASQNAVLGTVNQTGGGPAITLSQPDPYFLAFNCAHTFIKITTGGALGTATFRDSCDGVSYNAVDLVLQSQTNLPFVVNTTVETMTGIQLNAAAGTYQLNTVYDFTSSATSSNNNYPTIISSQANGDGTEYVSSGIIGNYSSVSFNTVAATGTVSVSSGSPIVTGSGTHFLQYIGAKDGDAFLIHVGTGNDQRFMVSAVISDNIIYLDPLYTPQFTASGKDFLYAAGAGFSQDPETGQQLGAVYDHCTTEHSATGFRLSGLGGAQLIAPHSFFHAVTGITIGTACAD